ncbi:MAG: DUF3037 domain-containing protein [Bacteroidota bacterium]
MPDKYLYEYASIRVVPKVEREEFLNVGVILFCKKRDYLAMKYQINSKRLGIFSPGLDVAELKNYLQVWDLICKGDPQGGKIALLNGASRFRWLTAAKSAILQCSNVHPGNCENPDKVLDRLFDAYVL